MHTAAYADTGQSPKRSVTGTHIHRSVTKEVSGRYTPLHTYTGQSPKRSVTGTHLHTQIQVSHH